MTYTEFEHSFDLGKFTASTWLGVKLLYQDYTPAKEHKLADLKSVILTTANALTWAEFQSNGMGWIIDKLKERAKVYIASNQDKIVTWVAKFPNKEVLEIALKSDTLDLKDTGIKWIVVYCPGMGINCFCEEVN